jgi:hypothetical protein
LNLPASPADISIYNIPLNTAMSDHQYKFNVSMSCGGCSGAVERILKRLDGQHIPNSLLRLLFRRSPSIRSAILPCL